MWWGVPVDAQGDGSGLVDVVGADPVVGVGPCCWVGFGAGAVDGAGSLGGVVSDAVAVVWHNTLDFCATAIAPAGRTAGLCRADLEPVERFCACSANPQVGSPHSHEAAKMIDMSSMRPSKSALEQIGRC